MPRWHGRQRAAMRRTVVSQITKTHLFSIGEACFFKEIRSKLWDNSELGH
ncbi:hypothetical protein Sbal223_1648 [Shewanella baltica OS223]|nr:hypothetical protein Sbal223_1648 [Shewanella baltica OS223]